ncbi:organic solvent tolerance protein OstA [Puteibacter caeruleilacunae]|nr:organic solvent tolerance protein OstA [Puteibacter caeruleilacunae]
MRVFNLYTRFFKSVVFIGLVILMASQTGYCQEKKEIHIENANHYKPSKDKKTDRLLGDVHFLHEGVNMYCDSAHFQSENDRFHGFNKVHFNQGDTLHMYCTLVKYLGQNQLAKARRNVKLVDKKVTLTTDSLDFDMEKSIGYYNYGGTLVDSANTLTSDIGQYYANENLFVFSHDVKLVNEDFTLYSDTLKYNTVTGRVFILGPTTIVTEDGTLYAEDGWYDTETNIAKLKKAAELKQEKHVLRGDTIIYTKETGEGRAFGNVFLEDFDNHMIITGNKAIYNDIAQTALVTDSAIFRQVSEADTLFLHADTLRALPDTIPDERIIRAYHNVRFFRTDLQGKCDSLAYLTNDSTVQMFHEPILWGEGNQMTGEQIEMRRKNATTSEVYITNEAFIIAMEDSVKYNQIKGRNMTGYIYNKKLSKVDVKGNGQAAYFIKEDEESTDYVGLNTVECSNIIIRLKENKISEIAFLEKPDARMVPVEHLGEEESRLSGFVWYDPLRPKDKNDIFPLRNEEIQKKQDD